MIQLDHMVKTPIYKQIIIELKKLIESTTLQYGYRLPSSRELAASLGINRSTVYRSYQELWAQGYIDCKPGTYTTVRYLKPVEKKPIHEKSSQVNWEDLSSSAGKKIRQKLLKKNKSVFTSSAIDFVSLSPDPRLYPVEKFRKCQGHVMKTKGTSLLQYGNPMGYKPLREFIAHRMGEHGMELGYDQILIANGIQQALNLALQLLIKPDSSIIVEEPTYSSILPIFSLYGIEVIGVPLKKDGLDLDQFEKILESKKPTLLYTMPNFQNPTGITTSHAHREKLISLCESANVLVVEDGFEEELKYFGKSILPLKSMDKKGIVIYLGTFSKVLFPGLRIGWIAADKDCVDRLGALKQVSDTTSNIIEQAALNRYCRSGEFEVHIKRMHREYRKRMKTAIAAAKQYIPARSFNYTIPAGGYTFWVEAKNPKLPEVHMLQKIRKSGVTVSPGSLFFANRSDKTCFRISIAHCNQEEIETGLKRLGAALSQL